MTLRLSSIKLELVNFHTMELVVRTSSLQIIPQRYIINRRWPLFQAIIAIDGGKPLKSHVIFVIKFVPAAGAWVEKLPIWCITLQCCFDTTILSRMRLLLRFSPALNETTCPHFRQKQLRPWLHRDKNMCLRWNRRQKLNVSYMSRRSRLRWKHYLITMTPWNHSEYTLFLSMLPEC